MKFLRRSNDKKTGFGAPEPPDTNWFAVVLLGAAGLLLCFLLYALLWPVLFGDNQKYEIVPFGSTDEAVSAPPTFTFAPIASPTLPSTETSTPTPGPALPITASTAPQIAEAAQIGTLSAEVSSVAFSPDGQMIAAGSYNGTVRIWDLATLLPLHEFKSDSNRVNSIAFAPDGRHIVAGGQDTTVRLWALAGGQETRLDGPTASVRDVVFSPDGTRIAAASDDGVIYVWDATGSPPALARLLSGHTSYATSVAFSPDGMIIAAGGEDDTIRLWNAATGARRGVLRGHTATVTSLAFSPDSTSIVSTSDDNSVRVWNVLTESSDVVVQGATQTLNDAAFSRDGSLIVTAGLGIDNNTARFYDATSHAEIRTPLTFSGPLNSIAFSPDGTLLATGGATYLTLWNTTSTASAPIPTAQPTAVIATAGVSGQGGALTCTLTVRSSEANMRSGPSTDSGVSGTLTAGETVQAAGWRTGTDSYTWWQLTNNLWVRGDAFINSAFPTIPAECLQLPPVADAPAGTGIAPTAVTVAPGSSAPATSAIQSNDSAICTLTVRSSEANMRSGPSTSYNIGGTLTAGETVQATGWSRDVEGYTWWLLANNLWTRGDAFISVEYPTIPDACLRLAEASAPTSTGQTTGTQAVTSGACVLTARRATVTLYSGPDESAQVAGTLTNGQTAQATGWSTADDGFTWWQLSSGAWARGDGFLDATNSSVPGACLSLPAATP